MSWNEPNIYGAFREATKFIFQITTFLPSFLHFVKGGHNLKLVEEMWMVRRILYYAVFYSRKYKTFEIFECFERKFNELKSSIIPLRSI